MSIHITNFLTPLQIIVCNGHFTLYCEAKYFYAIITLLSITLCHNILQNKRLILHYYSSGEAQNCLNNIYDMFVILAYSCYYSTIVQLVICFYSKFGSAKKLPVLCGKHIKMLISFCNYILFYSGPRIA